MSVYCSNIVIIEVVQEESQSPRLPGRPGTPSVPGRPSDPGGPYTRMPFSPLSPGTPLRPGSAALPGFPSKPGRPNNASHTSSLLNKNTNVWRVLRLIHIQQHVQCVTCLTSDTHTAARTMCDVSYVWYTYSSTYNAHIFTQLHS